MNYLKIMRKFLFVHPFIHIKAFLMIKYRKLQFFLHLFLNSDKLMMNSEKEIKSLRIFLGKENLASYIRMSLNRWFVKQQRLMEYTC
jgi:hypothetical protein